MKMNDEGAIATEPPSRDEMIAYLKNHFRYYTMNSWNRSTSYARNVKIYNLGLTREQESKAYDLIYAEAAFDEINLRIQDFAIEHDYEYQATFNGRSSGYIVLIKGGQRPSGYQSYCKNCCQLNYKRVLPPADTAEDIIRNYIRTHNAWIEEVYLRRPEIARLGLTNDELLKVVREAKLEKADGIDYSENNVCGRCGQPARVNFDKPHMQVYTQPGMGIDENTDEFDEWSDGDVLARHRLIKEFDQMVDDCIGVFKNMLDNCKVVEKTVMVPKTVRVLECSHQEA